MNIFSFFKKKPKLVNRVYILENEIIIPIKQISGDEVHNYSYSYGYENGWLKICLWGGTAYKKEVDKSEVETIITPIRDFQLNENQVHKYLTNIGGFVSWDYYSDFFKSDEVYL